MTELTPGDFGAFFQALWDYSPFPWQRRLAAQVCEGRGWPTALDLPTGTGKTAAIDIAVFHLALEAAKGQARTAPLRVVYVVDRRIVVDSAWERAYRIRRKLIDALNGRTDDILLKVALRLNTLSGEPKLPLAVARLRGGMPRETDWARTPVQPLVLCSTVDQAGSRLLFRGYGVSDVMKPVHAGLLGSDVLWLLDEAHLSQPFVQTLRAVERLRRPPWVDEEPVTPFDVVSLSATQGKDEFAFTLDHEDKANDELRRRLQAHKPARLVELSVPLAGGEQLAAAYADEAQQLTESVATTEQAPVVGVVVNRVRLARAIFDELCRRMQPDQAGATMADVTLLIGPIRPLDRDLLLRSLLPRIRAQGRRNGRHLFLVATQTIEVGADLDFDALVTQVAPLDALRQRFGRLDRLGNRTAKAAILATKEELAKANSDPIYATAATETWNWLNDAAASTTAPRRTRGNQNLTVDFGIAHLAELPNEARLQPLLTPRSDAPILLPAFVDLWAQTSPPPAADPDPSLFLHGPASGPADVTIVWRCDLDPGDDADKQATAIIEALPPSTLEGVQVSLSEARRWMRNAAQADLADVEGAYTTERSLDGNTRRGLWLWNGESCIGVRRIDDVRPGDVLLVSADEGGCDEFGWNPSNRKPISDLAELAALAHRHRLLLRVCRESLHDDLRQEGREAETSALWQSVQDEIGERAEEGAVSLVNALRTVSGLPPRWATWLDGLTGRSVQLLAPYGDDPADGRVLTLRHKLDEAEARRILEIEISRRAGVAATNGADPDSVELVGDDAGLGAATESDSGFAVPILLDQHLEGVEAFARRFALGTGLPEDIAGTIIIAARLHDTGKAERRFQALLRGGDIWATGESLLAKSGTRPLPAAERQMRERTGLLAGSRHECWSVVLAKQYLAYLEKQGQPCPDPELALWLIGTHHGWGRPFFPPVRDDEPGDVRVTVGGIELSAPVAHGLVRLDSGWPDRFVRALRRYGAWELARFEAILRLADHRQSDLESKE